MNSSKLINQRGYIDQKKQTNINRKKPPRKERQDSMCLFLKAKELSK